MKTAVLIIELADGKRECIQSDSSVPVMAAAKAMRASGKHGKAAVREGIVLTSWNIGPAYVFRCTVKDAPRTESAAAKSGKDK